MEYSEPGEIVQRIKQLILDRGVPPNQVRTQIMEVTGISKQGLSKWFSGDTPSPRTADLLRIAYYYKTDLNWIMTGLYAKEWYEAVNKATEKQDEKQKQEEEEEEEEDDKSNFNKTYSYDDKADRDSLASAAREGIGLGNAC